jgi:hypothetical protein
MPEMDGTSCVRCALCRDGPTSRSSSSQRPSAARHRSLSFRRRHFGPSLSAQVISGTCTAIAITIAIPGHRRPLYRERARQERGIGHEFSGHADAGVRKRSLRARGVRRFLDVAHHPGPHVQGADQLHGLSGRGRLARTLNGSACSAACAAVAALPLTAQLLAPDHDAFLP